MAPAWLNVYDPNEIAQKLEAARLTDSKGDVTFTGFAHFEHVVLLSRMVEIGGKIPEIEKRRIVYQATFKAANKGKITPQALLRAIGELEREYHDRDLRRYQMVTSLSAMPVTALRPTRILGTTINFAPHLAASFQRPRDSVQKNARDSIAGEIPTNYIYTKIGVSARSNAEAANHALDAIDLLRGIWNLFFNRGQLFRILSAKRNPVNKFVLGPVHTLHWSSGKLATDSWWYQTEYTGPIKTHDPRSQVDMMYKYTENVRKGLSKSCYCDSLQSAILRYTRALDLANWEDSFLRLWGVLEQLTHTRRDGYKVTIKRASFLFADREYHRLILTHLQNYRNETVHAGIDSHDIEAYMYQLKRYVEKALEFHLGNRFGFTSPEQAAKFMDLPDDMSQLDESIKIMRHAKNFLGNT